MPKGRERAKVSFEKSATFVFDCMHASQKSNTLSSCYFEFRKSNNALFTTEKHAIVCKFIYYTVSG